MTPLEALLAAIAAGARLSVDQVRGKLVVETDAAGDISSELLASLKEHRDWIIAHLLQPPRPPLEQVCPDCRHTAWWTRDEDGEQVCGLCHPDPQILLELWQGHQEAPME